MNEFQTTVISALARQANAQAEQAKAQELFQSTVLLELAELRADVLAIKSIAPDTKQELEELAEAKGTEQALKELAEAEDAELFSSWCAKSKAIENQIMEAAQAILSFWEELEETNIETALLIEAKKGFIEDNIYWSAQLLGAVDVPEVCGTVRYIMIDGLGLPSDP